MNTPRLRRGGGIASSSFFYFILPVLVLYFQHAHIDATHARGKVLRALMRIDVDRIALIS